MMLAIGSLHLCQCGHSIHVFIMAGLGCPKQRGLYQWPESFCLFYGECFLVEGISSLFYAYSYMSILMHSLQPSLSPNPGKMFPLLFVATYW